MKEEFEDTKGPIKIRK